MFSRYVWIVVLLLLQFTVKAQNQPQFTQYVFSPFYFNPGAAGQLNRITVQSAVRSQYLGYNPSEGTGGGIFSSAFSMDMPVNKVKGGVGVLFSNQKISEAQSRTEFTLNYAYHHRINNNIVGVGIGAGMAGLTLMGEDFIVRDPDDPRIPDTRISGTAPQINIGIFLYNPSYQVGLSVKDILEQPYNMKGLGKNFRENRNYYVYGKYDIGVSYTLDISPMFIYRSDLVSNTFELGVLATYNQRFFGGLNYRFQDAVAAIIGVDLLDRKLKIGYSIDWVTGGVEAKSQTSHELFLRYVLAPLHTGKRSIIKTPRYNIQ